MARKQGVDAEDRFAAIVNSALLPIVGADMLEAAVELFRAELEECEAAVDASSATALLAEVVLNLSGSRALEEADDDVLKCVCDRLSDLRLLQPSEREPATEELPAGVGLLARLEEDGAWHPAVVRRSREGGSNVVVQFTEFGFERSLKREDVAAHDSDDAEDGEENSQCKLCLRTTFTTQHHMIPRSEHRRHLGRPDPDGRCDAYTSAWLLSENNLVPLCRPCHSAIHRLATNAECASRLFTLERLRQDPKVAAFAAWQSKRRSEGNRTASGLHHKR